MLVPLKIGIIYICTGNYANFFSEFYETSQQHFFKGHELYYFVFTDSKQGNIFSQSERVLVIPQSHLDWPHAVLAKYRFILGETLDLQKMDYLFMVNANLVFLAEVGPEILPDDDANWLVGVRHPNYYGDSPDKFPFDRQPLSTAFIPHGTGRTYYQSAFAGGRTKEWLQLCTVLKRNTETDYINGIIALWHDESHINRYFLDHPPKTLSPSYLYPENCNLPFEPKIVQLDKTSRGGYANFRLYPSQRKAFHQYSIKNLLRRFKKAIFKS